jgi:tRNA-dihydrouridine synthase
VPVLGNGDVWECWDALRMLRETKCDGVIVGRGCLRRPWLFGELAAAFDGRMPAAQPRLGEIVDIMRRHAAALVELFGEPVGMREMRKWCLWYTSGFRGAAAVRGALPQLETLAKLDSILAHLDPDEPFPVAGLRASRAKDGRRQEVRLPDRYLAGRDDDRPPEEPGDEAFEAALGGG